VVWGIVDYVAIETSHILYGNNSSLFETKH